MLYYYIEAYNIHADTSRLDSIVVNRKILSAESKKQIKSTIKSYRAKGRNLVITDGFPVSTLRTGTYILEIDVYCPFTDKMATSQKKFWMHRPEDLLDVKLLSKNQSLDQQDINNLQSADNILEIIKPDSALELMKYLFTSEEAKRIKRLNTEGKNQFFYNYWREKEASDPNSANKYFARVAEANTRYSYLKKSGWKTDRGRVFIMYGEPDNYNRNYLGTSDIDNEVWNYDHLEGGVIFVFKDLNGFGDLELVHSTKRGEISNPKWFDTSQSGRFSNPNDITR
jgi:GWxTD domain-containing protein